jgi:SpoVK/Ycf46/Vps4 family AAA+-type ATPase
VARAVAGEMGAKFISVGLSDILDMWVGNSEKNIHELFTLARAQAPVVLFLDEIDALGQKRSQTRQSAMRGSVNQLLTELDGVDGANEGVFVLSTRRYAAPVASIAPCSCCHPMLLPEKRSCVIT